MARDDELAKWLLGQEKAVSTSRLGRLLGTGRSAVGLAATVLRGRDAKVNLESIGALTERLAQLRGLGMKMGQIISFIDPSIPPEAQALLAVLQRQAPASESKAVQGVLREALGEARATQLWAQMEPRPFAVASIAQVHRARLAGYGELAVKVRHPGIAQALSADFSGAVGGVQLANLLTFGAADDARALVDEARTAMLDECDFRKEAAYQRAFFEWLKTDARLVVPEVIEAWSTEAVLTSRWEPGLSLDQFLAAEPNQAERDAAGEALFRASVGGFYSLGLLHADPHPGNFAFREGRVVLYDFGCVRSFSRQHREAFAQMPQALRRGDRAGLVDAATRFGFKLRAADDAESLERFARAFFFPLLQDGPTVIPPDGAVDMKQAMKDKRAMARLGMPRHLLFLLRLRFGLYAVLSRLGARCDWGELERQAFSGMARQVGAAEQL